jgi:hypothetical protein
MGYLHRHLVSKIRTFRAAGVIQRLFPFLCRFSDAGNDEAGHRLGDRRRNSAEARNRGGVGTVGAAGSSEDAGRAVETLFNDFLRQTEV